MAHWLDKAVDLFNAETDDLAELAGIAGYNPKYFYSGTISDSRLRTLFDQSDRNNFSPPLKSLIEAAEVIEIWYDKMSVELHTQKTNIDNILYKYFDIFQDMSKKIYRLIRMLSSAEDQREFRSKVFFVYIRDIEDVYFKMIQYSPKKEEAVISVLYAKTCLVLLNSIEEQVSSVSHDLRCAKLHAIIGDKFYQRSFFDESISSYLSGIRVLENHPHFFENCDFMTSYADLVFKYAKADLELNGYLTVVTQLDHSLDVLIENLGSQKPFNIECAKLTNRIINIRTDIINKQGSDGGAVGRNDVKKQRALYEKLLTFECVIFIEDSSSDNAIMLLDYMSSYVKFCDARHLAKESAGARILIVIFYYYFAFSTDKIGHLADPFVKPCIDYFQLHAAKGPSYFDRGAELMIALFKSRGIQNEIALLSQVINFYREAFALKLKDELPLLSYIEYDLVRP